MYNIISQLINHTWATGSGAPGDQQYIYYILGAVIPLLIVLSFDLLYQLIRSFFRFNK